jgi:hypothetical protein
MTDNNDNDMEMRTAAAKDYYTNIVQDLETMPPARLAVARKAIADFEQKAAAAADDKDFDRKVARMGTQEFNKLIDQVNYDTQPRLKGPM